MIAMQAPIYDEHAVRFSQEFYRALAEGYSVEQAVGEGRNESTRLPAPGASRRSTSRVRSRSPSRR